MNEHVSELSAHATPIEVTDSGVPDRILIAPWGWVESRAGSFLVDTEAARTTLDAFEEAGVDVPVDYEHQTLGGAFASPSGQAPAAGWIQRLEVVEGQGILAQVSWTPLARERLARREYRYLSPVAIVRTRDQRLVGLHSAALTNKPAIVEMQPIVNRQHSQEPEERTVMNEPLNALRELVTLDASVGVDEVLVAAKEHIVMLHEQLAQRDAEERVLRAIEAGKLTEAQREWAVALALKDPQAFEA